MVVSELAPVSVHGRAPGRLLAAMSVARIGDVEVEDVTWSADSAVATLRTERLIRARDPECPIHSGLRMGRSLDCCGR